MHATPPETSGWSARNWLFTKVETDEGIVGGGAMTGIEMALWDIKGKALGQPV